MRNWKQQYLDYAQNDLRAHAIVTGNHSQKRCIVQVLRNWNGGQL